MYKCVTLGAMLVEIARSLDDWIAAQNAEFQTEGLPLLRACTLKVIGQSALLETGLAVPLASTMDVDMKGELDFPVRKRLEQLLAAQNRSLDPVSHEAWMPRETTYREAYAGRFVKLLIAEPEAVLVSKALKAPLKNRVLLTSYLASGPSERFLTLAGAYDVNLEQFL